MSDVVAVSIIASGASLIGAGLGAFTTYSIGRRSAEATVVAAEGTNKIEMAKISAENLRLRTQHGEEERRNRQATYHRAFTVLQRLYDLGPDDAGLELDELATEWRYCLAGVQIFGTSKAVEAIDGVQGVVQRFDDPNVDRATWQAELKSTSIQFIDAVREDVLIDASH